MAFTANTILGEFVNYTNGHSILYKSKGKNESSRSSTDLDSNGESTVVNQQCTYD